jgi:tetratricopeptide (TPR) repeat protein
MARQWIKEELKKDFFQNFIEKTVPYVKSHREQVIVMIAVVVIIIVITIVTINRLKESSQLANEQVGFAAMYLRGGYADQTIKICDEIIQTHPSGIQGGYAYFYKAESLFLKKNYEEAIKAYQNALPLLRKKEDMGAMILFSMGNSYENSGKYQDALNTFKQLTDEFSAHYLVPEVQIAIARCYEILGDIQSAISYYQTVGSLHPTTVYKNIADSRLQVLEKQKVIAK